MPDDFQCAAVEAAIREGDPGGGRVAGRTAYSFSLDWRRMLEGSEEPILVVGNPPWVTNSARGRFGSRHLPPKHRMSGLRGIEALTGKSNFDVSESMLIEQLRWLDNAARTGVDHRRAASAVLRSRVRPRRRPPLRVRSNGGFGWFDSVFPRHGLAAGLPGEVGRTREQVGVTPLRGCDSGRRGPP